jgi:hypothetical protein
VAGKVVSGLQPSANPLMALSDSLMGRKGRAASRWTAAPFPVRLI